MGRNTKFLWQKGNDNSRIRFHIPLHDYSGLVLVLLAQTVVVALAGPCRRLALEFCLPRRAVLPTLT